MRGDLSITGDPAADELLNTDPLALVLGMLLDQQVTMAWAFRGPATLAARLGGRLDAATLAAMDRNAVVEVFCRKPAVHRYPAAMAARAHELCIHLVEHHGGDAGALWADGPSAAELHRRVRALPGFGDEKAMIFLALLAKRMGVAPPRWEDHAGVFADDVPRSVADCHDAESLARVKAFKQAMRDARRDKQGRPLA